MQICLSCSAHASRVPKTHRRKSYAGSKGGGGRRGGSLSCSAFLGRAWERGELALAVAFRLTRSCSAAEARCCGHRCCALYTLSKKLFRINADLSLVQSIQASSQNALAKILCRVERRRRKARREPLKQCVPRQSLGTRRIGFGGCVSFNP